jgi:hypothetical protein
MKLSPLVSSLLVVVVIILISASVVAIPQGPHHRKCSNSTRNSGVTMVESRPSPLQCSGRWWSWRARS